MKTKKERLAYMKEYYKRRPQYFKSIAARQRVRKLEFINRLKCQPCMDCGKTFNPWIMEFDHRDPSTKTDCVSSLMRHGSQKDLEIEIAKCDVVCANCHADRTHKRGY